LFEEERLKTFRVFDTTLFVEFMILKESKDETAVDLSTGLDVLRRAKYAR
jgi:hypothetical protein